MKDQDLIKSLSQKHSKVKTLPNANKRALTFGVISFFSVLILMYFNGGFRVLSNDYGFNFQTLELVSIFVAFFSIMIVSFNSSIPGNTINSALKVFYTCSFLFGISLLYRYLFIPDGYAPMLTRVFHCTEEVLAYATLIQFFLYWRVSKGVLLSLKKTVIFTTLTAATLPLMLMALGCCIRPVHIFTSHFAPLAIYTVVVGIAQYYFLRKKYEY